jgi:hypothetical protein
MKRGSSRRVMAQTKMDSGQGDMSIMPVTDYSFMEITGLPWSVACAMRGTSMSSAVFLVGPCTNVRNPRSALTYTSHLLIKPFLPSPAMCKSLLNVTQRCSNAGHSLTIILLTDSDRTSRRSKSAEGALALVLRLLTTPARHLMKIISVLPHLAVRCCD